MPGIESVNITIADNTSFEIARRADGEPNGTTEQLPKYAEMQVNFKPIHSI